MFCQINEQGNCKNCNLQKGYDCPKMDYHVETTRYNSKDVTYLGQFNQILTKEKENL